MIQITNHQYPLVNVYITMENHHAITGKTHYFDWAIFNSYVSHYQRDPEGRSPESPGISDHRLQLHRGHLPQRQPPAAAGGSHDKQRTPSRGALVPEENHGKTMVKDQQNDLKIIGNH